MNDGFPKIFTVRYEYTGHDAQLAPRLLVVNFLWAVIVLIATVLARWLFSSLTTGYSIGLPMLTLSGVWLVHSLIQRGHLVGARRSFVLSLLATTVLLFLPDYRIDTPLIIGLALPLTAGGWLLRRQELLGLVLIMLFIMGLAAITQAVNDMGPTPLGSTAEGFRVTMLLIGSVLLLNMLLLGLLNDDLSHMQHQQQNLRITVQTSHDFTVQLAQLPRPGEALNTAIEQLRDGFNLYHAQVFQVDPVSGLAILKASTGYLGRRLLEEESLLAPDINSPVNEVLRVREALLVTEYSSEIRRQGFLPGTRIEYLIPLRVETDTVLGVLDLHSSTPTTFDAITRQALNGLANHLATAIFAQQQAANATSARAIQDSLTAQVETSQRELNRINRQLINTTWGRYLHDQQGNKLGFDWVQGTTSPPAKESEIIEQTLHDGQARRLQLSGQTQVLCVPIRLRGQTLGALEFRRTASATWSSVAQELAEAVAERLALSLENVRLFEQAQITAQREQLVAQITTQLQTSTDLENLMATAATQFQTALGAIQTRVRLGLPHMDTSPDEQEEHQA